MADVIALPTVAAQPVVEPVSTEVALSDGDRELVRECCFQIEALMQMLMATMTDARSEHSAHVRAVAVRVQDLGNAIYGVVEQDGASVGATVFGLRL